MSLFKLPTTGVVDFGTALDASHGPWRSLGGRLVEATALRGKVRAHLKEAKRREDDKGDHGLVVIKAIEDYLPHLVAIAHGVKADYLIGTLVFSWASVLTGHKVDFVSHARVDMPEIASETILILWTLALAYSNLAMHRASTVPEPRPEDGIDLKVRSQLKTGRKTAELRETLSADEAGAQLNQAAAHYCQAAGILDYISTTVMPQESANLLDVPKIPEFSPLVVRGVAAMLTARAEATAIKKLQAVSSGRSTDLPRPGLLAKIHLHVVAQYEDALSLFEHARRTGLELSHDLIKGVQQASYFHAALARKFLAMDAAASVQMGHALAFLDSSRKYLTECLGPLGTNKGLAKLRDRRDELVRMALEEVVVIDELLLYYTKLNQSIHFQAKTQASTINSLIPSGRAVLTSKAFRLPEPGFTSAQPSTRTESRSLDTEPFEEMDNETTEMRSGMAYANQGAYY